jgi:hypothetical protein
VLFKPDPNASCLLTRAFLGPMVEKKFHPDLQISNVVYHCWSYHKILARSYALPYPDWLFAWCNTLFYCECRLPSLFRSWHQCLLGLKSMLDSTLKTSPIKRIYLYVLTRSYDINLWRGGGRI